MTPPYENIPSNYNLSECCIKPISIFDSFIRKGGKKMKRFAYITVCVLLLAGMIGCHSNDSTAPIDSGVYYVVGDYSESDIPVLVLDTENNSFALKPFSKSGIGHYGSFEIKDQQLIATVLNCTFVFEIKDKHTLILTEEGDTSYDVPYNSEFLFSEGLR